MNVAVGTLGEDAVARANPVPLTEHPYFPVVESVVQQLADGADHPEVWAALAAAAEHDVTDLRDLLDALRPGQSGAILKGVNVIGGVLHALTVDRLEGIAFLNRLASEQASCPQIAGATFFVQRHGQPGLSADLSDRFCESPFVKFETLMDGSVAPCCSIWTEQRLGNLDGQTFEQIWNSPAAQDMRGSILDGSYRHCHKQRCDFIVDGTLPKRDEVVDPEFRAIIDEGRTELSSGPRWLFLAHDVTCNLACPSCRDGILVADDAQEQRFEVIERDVFRPLLNAEGEPLISVSGQGDPWSSPHYRSILRYMSDHDVKAKLAIHTNALLMGEGRWAQYPGLEKYRAAVIVSIDACTPWVYQVVRRPGKWEKLYPNLEFISAKRARGEFSEYSLNTTVQLDNYHEMAGLVELTERLGADSVLMYMIQNTGGHLAKDFARKNVAASTHPLHLAFLETLRDERLAAPVVQLYDVANWRARAFEVELPSDSLPKGYSRAELQDALIAARGNAERVVALCAAGRTHFRTDLDLLLLEAQALAALGFAEQGAYRLKEREALGGEAIVPATLGWQNAA
ncbi:hypothetical protein E5A73_08145 [Sphingomonas gei]|uniref:4Fe4S-binding SPASM domain-containing protein n=1 Tax=Sphingomonas gei TaxID=1395960 RepID=A0A4S1XCC5_9SPHN|nr:SPASM domain-containing protein [Sphingomonas gei]TGX54084.1 hypothetical protein E5A73_08145 [Sphingomonas gei]